ncbi:MAG: nucleotidyltransferase family protein [Armatimonadetes bacterium]|nr:nucleotidyltransferase family protein [Armatimonadota bacterium]
MQALILAAGYATRLYPLTQTCAKPLLPIGGRALIDHITERILTLDGLTRLHVVANDRFYLDFQRWAETWSDRIPVSVYNDGTFDNADRRGAIGDAEWVIDQAAIDDDLLLVAGDNLFDFDMRALRAFQLEHGTSIVTYHFADASLIPQYSTVEVDDNHLVTAFAEKPEAPTTDLIGICCYLFSRVDVPRVREYLAEGNNKDAPGHFIAWLHRQVPVHAFEFDGLWYDIGDMRSLTEADRALRARAGLPTRDCYELEP